MTAPPEITISPAAHAVATPKIGSSLLVSASLHVTVIVAFFGVSWLVSPDSVSVQLNAGDASEAADATVQLTASLVVDPAESASRAEASMAHVSLSPPESREPDTPEPCSVDAAEVELEPVDRGEGPPVRPRQRNLLASSAMSPPRFAEPLVSPTDDGAVSGLRKVAFDSESPRLDPSRIPPKPPAKRSELKPPPDNELTQPAASDAPPASENSPASEKLGAKVDDVPRPLASNVPPEFPAAALTEGRSGRVVLKVVVDSAGEASLVSVHRSSGHADLDAAACSAVAQWRFTPVKRPDGGLPSAPVVQAIAVPIVFEFADE